MRAGGHRVHALWWAVALACVVPEPEVGSQVPGSGARTFSQLENEVLVPRCAMAGCHTGDPPTVFPSLDAGLAYQQIVQVGSELVPGASLVEPFDPGGSVLLQTLQGGGPSPMPVGETLEESDIAAIEAWIASGAPND